jgi:hypothetical protein
VRVLNPGWRGGWHRLVFLALSGVGSDVIASELDMKGGLQLQIHVLVFACQPKY